MGSAKWLCQINTVRDRSAAFFGKSRTVSRYPEFAYSNTYYMLRTICSKGIH